MKNLINNNATLIQLIVAGVLIAFRSWGLELVGWILFGYTFAGGKLKV